MKPSYYIIEPTSQNNLENLQGCVSRNWIVVYTSLGLFQVSITIVCILLVVRENLRFVYCGIKQTVDGTRNKH
jgi:hypothetical protein